MIDVNYSKLMGQWHFVHTVFHRISMDLLLEWGLLLGISGIVTP